jgi:hypothetical protein
MKILIVNQYAGSPKMGMEFRLHYSTQECANCKCEDFLLCFGWEKYEQSIIKQNEALHK